VTSLSTKFYTISEAARVADRSKEVIRRWVTEGWIPEQHVFITPGRNGPWLIERAVFDNLLPAILQEMGQRKGGRGHRAQDANGYNRGA
jgi:hypothetical protein